MKKSLLTVVGLVVALAWAMPPAYADDDDHHGGQGQHGWGGHDHDHDHDRARRAMLAGEIVPLSRILDRVEHDFSGELVEAELDDKHGQLVYEIKLIGSDGRMRKVLYDARNGTVLSSQERR